MKHTKEDILQGGIELFRKNGYQGTGVQQILTSLNIPKGSFYNYFKSKEEFAMASIELYTNNSLKNQNTKLTNQTLSPINRIIKLMKSVEKLYITESFEKSCLLDMFATEVCGNNDKISVQIDKIYENRNTIWANCIKEGQELNEIRKDETAENLAEFLLHGYSGAQLKAKTERSIRPMKNFTKQFLNYISV